MGWSQVGADAGTGAATVLGDLTWPEAERHAARDAVLAVPLGSTEQHGPHLPLSTDTDVAVAVARGLAAAPPAVDGSAAHDRIDVVVAPAVGYGASGEHAGFAGTVSIGAAALETVLVELGRSATETFRHVVLVSTHGGNDGPVRAATVRLRAESRDVLAWFASGITVPGDWSVAGVAGDAHAGRAETSIQLALGPARVRADLAAAGNRAPLVELMPALRAGGVRAVSANGVLGDPAGASAAEGAALLAGLTANLTAAVRSWLSAGSAPPVADPRRAGAR